MKQICIFILVGVIGACSVGPKIPTPETHTRVPAETTTFSGLTSGLSVGLYKGPILLPTGDVKRAAAKLYLPLQYEQKANWPLVILLHGFTGTAEAEDAYLGTRFRVSSLGFILLTPEGTAVPAGTKGGSGEDLGGKQFWNATDTCCDFGRTGVDDAGYLTRLIEETASQYNVDRNRIYIFGHSNGGFMANRLACEIGDRLAGVASLAGGTFKDPSACKNTAAVPYLQIHATDDPTIVYGEDPNYAGATATVDQWVKRNKCVGSAHDQGRRDYVLLVPIKDTTVKTWLTCGGGAPVSFWTIQPHTGKIHNPHVPLFNPNFTTDVLNFLFSQKRQ